MSTSAAKAAGTPIRIGVNAGTLKAESLRRPEGDVHFVCNDGRAMAELVSEAVKTGERVNRKVHIDAIVPSKSAEPAATFALTISLKKARR